MVVLDLILPGLDGLGIPRSPCFSSQAGWRPEGEDLIFNRILSLIMAMNSELVGLPLALLTVYPKKRCNVSRSHGGGYGGHQLWDKDALS